MACVYLDTTPTAIPLPTVDAFSAGSRARRAAPSADPATPTWKIPGRRQVDLLAIAEGFGASAADIAELHGGSERSWVLLAATDLFEAWAIGWPPGGTIELHDHGTSGGAVFVAHGSLRETRVRPTDHGVALLSSHHLDVGENRTFGPGYVHDIINDGTEEAISVHVYGPKLSTMTYYKLSRQGRLDTVRTDLVEPVGPFDSTRAHDPS